jgi:hypothetical protein
MIAECWKIPFSNIPCEAYCRVNCHKIEYHRKNLEFKAKMRKWLLEGI